MTAPGVGWRRVDNIHAGERVRYDASIWTVHEALPVAPNAADHPFVSRWAVIATADTAPRPIRTVLNFRSPAALIEVIIETAAARAVG